MRVQLGSFGMGAYDMGAYGMGGMGACGRRTVRLCVALLCVCWAVDVAGGVTMCSVSPTFRCPHAGVFPHHNQPKVYYRCESRLLPATRCVCPAHTAFHPRLHLCTYTPHSNTNDDSHAGVAEYGGYGLDPPLQQDPLLNIDAPEVVETPRIEPSSDRRAEPPTDQKIEPSTDQSRGNKMHKRPKISRAAKKHKRDKSQKSGGKKSKCKDEGSENESLKATGCHSVTTAPPQTTTPVNRDLPSPQPYKQPQEARVLYDNSLVPAWAIALLVLIVIIMAMVVVMVMY